MLFLLPMRKSKEERYRYIVGVWPQLDKRPMEAVILCRLWPLFLQKEPKDETPDKQLQFDAIQTQSSAQIENKIGYDLQNAF